MAGKHSMDDNEVPKAFRKTEVNNNTEEFYNGGKRERRKALLSGVFVFNR